jgi:pantothenate kinase
MLEQSHYQYISDSQGQRTHVVLPIADFEEMFEEVKAINETLIVPEIATLNNPLITTKYVLER